MGASRDSRRGAGPALKARRTLRPTRAGWVFFAFTLGVGFAALNTGNNLLYLVFSLMLAFLVLSGVLSESALRGIEVVRRLPRELYAGVGNTVRLEVRNTQKRVAAYAIVVEDRIAAEGSSRGEVTPIGRAFTLRIGAGETVATRYTLEPEQRGMVAFAPVVVSTRFPFALFLKSRVLDGEGQALVYPALHDQRPAAPDGGAQQGGESESIDRSAGTNVAGVREFRPGDSLRRVHWKSSLRRRALLVLQMEEDRDAEVQVELTTRTGSQEPRDAGFEWRVSRAATEVVTHLDAGLRVGLRTETEQIPADSGPRQRARLLAFLARVDALQVGA